MQVWLGYHGLFRRLDSVSGRSEWKVGVFLVENGRHGRARGRDVGRAEDLLLDLGETR